MGEVLMHRKFKIPSIGLGAVVLVAATVFAVATPALAASSRAASKPMTKEASAHALAEARAFLSHIKVGAPLHGTGTVHEVTTDGVTQLKSTNWSGYGDPGANNSFSAVSGTWVEPTATCGSTTSLAAFWVGLDGLSDSTVEQDGTIIECVGGAAAYYDWWETYPGNAVQIIHNVSPGDSISAKVTHSGSSYTMAVTDNTHSGNSFSVSKPCGASACDNASAEWIAEAPCCSGSSVYPLSNFGTWKVTNAQTTYLGTPGTITVDPNQDEITMVDSGNAVKAQPGVLKLAGAKFKDVWKRST